MKYSELSSRRANPLLDRVCLRCDAKMWLTDIEPGAPGQHKLVFDCFSMRGPGQRRSQYRQALPLASKPGGSAMPDWLGSPGERTKDGAGALGPAAPADSLQGWMPHQ